MPLYNDQGEPVEGALAPEEAKALQEKAALADTLQAQVAEKDEALSKLQDKDFNFAALKAATVAERDALLSKHSEKEKTLILQIEQQNKEIEEIRTGSVKEATDSMLTTLAGDDADLKKQIELAASEFVGEAKTKAEIAARLEKAYTIVKGMKPSIGALNKFVPTGAQSDLAGSNKFVDTETGKATYKAWFPNDPQPK